MKLDRYLTTHHLSHEDFAALIGTTARSVARYARGERIPRSDEMQRIIAATAGGVTPNDFYGVEAEACPQVRECS